MNKKMRSIILCLLIVISNAATAQTIEILNADSTSTFQKQKSFIFLEPQTDTANLKFIATIKATGQDEDASLDFMFTKIKKIAENMGANIFKLNAHNKTDSPAVTILSLDIYYANDSILKKNSINNKQNTVYIFGNPHKLKRSTSFKIDGNKKEIKGGTYYKYVLDAKQEIKINKGGITGFTIWIKWKENKPATFLTLSGFGVGGGAPMPAGQVGITFNTGRINYIDADFGRLMIALLLESE
jgi:hypothetical protein